MAKIVDKGLIGGHLPTGGFYADASTEAAEAILSAFEAQAGSTPLIRVRMDLDGDGVYEVVESEDVMSVGNLSHAIEYYTNKPTFGSANFTMRNNDCRYSDNNPAALTYFDPANPSRYHMRKVLIEIGFDGPNKQSSWRPLFTGFIIQKDEKAEEREADFGLMDEWVRLSSFDLAPTILGDVFFNYTVAKDTTLLQLGTYYGAHRFLVRESTNQTNQLIIPCSTNISEAWFLTDSGYVYTVNNLHYLIKPLILNWAAYKKAYSNYTPVLYFWDWGAATKQWIEISSSYYSVVSGHIVLNTGNIGLSKTVTQYFDTTNPDCDPAIAISIEGMDVNPARILFDVLYNVMGLPINDIDASNADPTLWGGFDVDFSSEDYHSFDVSARYLEMMQARTCVHINKSCMVSDLINEICPLTRGSFFIDRGRTAGPERRIRFVIHQPRLVPDTILTLPESRVHTPVLSRSTDKVRNNVSVSNYDFTSVTSKYDTVTVYNKSDANSIAVYGQKDQLISNKPGDNIFLYDSAGYAAMLASHYLMIFKEPLIELTFDTDLVGMNFYLKTMLRIQEKSSLYLNQDIDNIRNVFEVYSMAMNTGNFLMSFVALWAGYLLMPDGDKTKRWAFADYFWVDADADGNTYWFW